MREAAFIVFFMLAFTGMVSNYTENGKRYQNLLYWIAGVLLMAFAGLREIGIDHDSLAYLNYYEMGQYIWIMAEPTFGVISGFVKYLFDDFRFVLIIYAILGVALKFKAIKKLTELHWLTLVVYFSTYFLLHEFTQIRAAVASGLVLLSIIPIAERKPGKFLALIFIAILFHYSAFVVLPLYFLTNRRMGMTWKFTLWLLIPAGIVLHYMQFNPVVMIPIETIKLKIEIYQKGQEANNIALNVFNLVYLVKYLILYFLLIYYELLYRKTQYISLLLKIYALSLFAYLALSSNTIFAMRISEMLGIVEIILIPYFYYLFRPAWIGAIIVAFIALIYLIINIYSLELIYPVAKLYY